MVAKGKGKILFIIECKWDAEQIKKECIVFGFVYIKVKLVL